MNELDAELALDRLEARLAAELPAHLAAAAHAYAHGTSVAALSISHRETAAVLAARSIESLRPRATRLLRVIAPIVIETAPRVADARAAPRSWAAYRVLTAERDAYAHLRFGVSLRALVHALAGLSTIEVAPDDGIGPEIAGWRTHVANDAWGVVDDDIRAMWRSLVGDARPFGELSILRSATAHPRTFVVERGVRATIVVPAVIDTPAARFAVLHELGHALLWLAPTVHEWPRVLDEAAASHIARTMESEGADGRWFSPLARAARTRRLAIARALDAIEAGREPAFASVPWALWNDPCAQAVYVEAERIADAMPPGLRGGALAAHLAPMAANIDR